MTRTIQAVTQLEPSDLAALLAASEAEGFRFVRRVAEEWASGANRFAGPGEALFVAIEQGRWVGICGLMRDPYAGLPNVGRLRNLYVLPAVRGRGIGADLTRAVITAAAGSFARLRLRTSGPQASRLYERLGFRPTRGEEGCTHALVPRSPL
ncbi:MAG TPA: GNAT family N-acetyltransferase [Thermoanaerobaculia bacterium]|nr:GNAT family N-acetyltransferase [Thermoanaerobaculia bacterium]